MSQAAGAAALLGGAPPSACYNRRWSGRRKVGAHRSSNLNAGLQATHLERAAGAQRRHLGHAPAVPHLHAAVFEEIHHAPAQVYGARRERETEACSTRRLRSARSLLGAPHRSASAHEAGAGAGAGRPWQSTCPAGAGRQVGVSHRGQAAPPTMMMRRLVSRARWRSRWSIRPRHTVGTHCSRRLENKTGGREHGAGRVRCAQAWRAAQASGL